LAQFLAIHPETPQRRLIDNALDILVRQRGVAALPTDTGYALACCMGNKVGVDTIRQLRSLDDKHNFTLACSDLSALATFAKVGNVNYRLIRNNTPGPYTWVLPATSVVPRRLLHPKRRTIGMRVPDNPILHAILSGLDEPLMTATCQLPGDEYPLTDAYDIRDSLSHGLDVIVDGGYCGMEPSTVIDLTGESPVLIRQGAGDFSVFET